jgi:hypothetical protein
MSIVLIQSSSFDNATVKLYDNATSETKVGNPTIQKMGKSKKKSEKSNDEDWINTIDILDKYENTDDFPIGTKFKVPNGTIYTMTNTTKSAKETTFKKLDKDGNVRKKQISYKTPLSLKDFVSVQPPYSVFDQYKPDNDGSSEEDEFRDLKDPDKVVTNKQGAKTDYLDMHGNNIKVGDKLKIHKWGLGSKEFQSSVTSQTATVLGVIDESFAGDKTSLVLKVPKKVNSYPLNRESGTNKLLLYTAKHMGDGEYYSDIQVEIVDEDSKDKSNWQTAKEVSDQYKTLEDLPKNSLVRLGSTVYQKMNDPDNDGKIDMLNKNINSYVVMDAKTNLTAFSKIQVNEPKKKEDKSNQERGIIDTIKPNLEKGDIAHFKDSDWGLIETSKKTPLTGVKKGDYLYTHNAFGQSSIDLGDIVKVKEKKMSADSGVMIRVEGIKNIWFPLTMFYILNKLDDETSDKNDKEGWISGEEAAKHHEYIKDWPIGTKFETNYGNQYEIIKDNKIKLLGNSYGKFSTHVGDISHIPSELLTKSQKRIKPVDLDDVEMEDDIDFSKLHVSEDLDSYFQTLEEMINKVEVTGGKMKKMKKAETPGQRVEHSKSGKLRTKTMSAKEQIRRKLGATKGNIKSKSKLASANKKKVQNQKLNPNSPTGKF